MHREKSRAAATPPKNGATPPAKGGMSRYPQISNSEGRGKSKEKREVRPATAANANDNVRKALRDYYAKKY